MPVKLRPAAITLCLASLAWLCIPGGASASPSRPADSGRATAAVQDASTPSLSGGGRSGLSTVGLRGWQVQSTAATTDWTTGTGATQSGNEISEPGFDTSGWLTVQPDSTGAVGTEVEALLQHGICPDDSSLEPVNQSPYSHASVFYSDNLQNCFGAPMTNPAADTNPLFDLPWWFRTDFVARPRSGQDEKLVINGVMGQADVWVNGTEIATQATVEGDYTSYTFDVSNLLSPGVNTLALELYPNNPSTMFTLDDVDWNQIPPDNNTGIQFPIQLHVSDALGISNTYVTQQDTADLSSAALTVHADVTNNTPEPQTGTVAATITPPGGGSPIAVSQPVSLGPSQSTTVIFSPTAYGQLTIDNPQIWWPYQMGGQPLYELKAAVFGQGGLSDAAPGQDFGIRSVATYLTKPSTLLPEGARVFEVNGVPFDFRAGGWSENIFLHYSASDLASQITLMKSMGINGVRTEGKEMPQDFYNQMDQAGILVDAGFQCCDKWAPPSSGRSVTAQDYRVMYESALTIGEQLRDHPSVLNFSWSDNNPIAEQEVVSDAGFSQSGFTGPIISSAEYNPSAIYGPSGEKEGPYDWVPPSYWYTTNSSNNALDEDSTLTNVGGAWGFDSEQSAGDTVPTMDSIERFMSPADQAALWQEPDAHQFHTNYESTDGTHSGYAFGTLDNLDTAIAARYGQWHSLAQYVQEAQVQNYEDTRAQFEAFIDHWNSVSPSTGTDYWQLNKGWPTLLWDLYNNDYDEAGSYFGAKKANEDLHVLYAYDSGKVTIDNLTGVSQPGLTVQSRVYDLGGAVLDNQTTSGPITLAPQQVRTGVLTPKVPAVTKPPTPATTYFVELILRQHGTVVDRNVYWLSTQQDVIDWDTGNPNDTTEGNPQADNGAPLSQYADMTALQQLPSESVQVSADTVRQPGPDGDDLTTNVTITDPSSNKAVAFFLRADVRRGTAAGTAGPGDNEVLPITWTDNDITLWPGQSETLTASYRSVDLHGAAPVVSVYGWNVPQAVFAAPQSAAAVAAVRAASSTAHVEYFGNADGLALVKGTARPGVGSQPGTASANPSRAGNGPRWSITAVANSPDTTPSTSFTQGDDADTYTLTVRNTGNAPTDGQTPVRVTDIIDPNINFTSIAGTGWTCNSNNNPTLVCTETGGSGGKPAVLQPGQSYPPITLTVQVPLGTGYGNNDSNDGLHVTNAAFASGGAKGTPTVSLASPTPIAGVPELTADNAVDGAFRQGDNGERYEITVINEGGAATTGSTSDPITATVTAPAAETIQDLYGSGWTCNLAAITAPQAEPADTCYRSDVLAGENGEDPPITVIVSMANNAPASATESVTVAGGGSQGGPSTVTAPTTIEQAADLNAASTHAGSFAQAGTGSYTLTVSNVDGPNASSTGGPAYGLVSVADDLPWGLTATALSGSGWTCDVSAVACYRNDALAAGTSYPPITLAVKVAANAPASVTNSVTVSGGGMTSGADSSTAAGGQTGTDPTTITQTGPAGSPPPPPAAPSLAVTSTHSGSFAQGDASDSYRLSVSDAASAGPASGMVTVTDTLPAGLTPVEMAGQGWTCSLAPAVYVVTSTSRRGSVPNTYEPQATCFRFGPLAPGSSYPPITLQVAVANNTEPSVTNQVTVAGDGASGPATGSDTTAVTQLPELAVSSFDSGGGVPYGPFLPGGAGQHDTYNITVSNVGYAATTGAVTFAADLPDGVQALSMSGPGWSCTLATATCSTDGGVSLAAGQQDQITLTVGVSAAAAPDLQTFMQASGGGEVPSAGLDENNDYSTVTNGGSYVDPTYVRTQG